MKCSNPACNHELFKVTVEKKFLRLNVEKLPFGRLPITLVCAKCGKPVKAWVTNEQLKQLVVILVEFKVAMTDDMKEFIEFIRQQEKPKKKGLLDRLRG